MIENLHDFFEDHTDEFLKFERVENKLSSRPDIHAFILLNQLVPGEFDMVSDAQHDEIFLEVSPDQLVAAATEKQLIDLHRCGVRHDSQYDCLCMFT